MLDTLARVNEKLKVYDLQVQERTKFEKDKINFKEFETGENLWQSPKDGVQTFNTPTLLD